MRRGRPRQDVADGRKSDGTDAEGYSHCTCSDGEVTEYFCKQCQALICKYCKSNKHRHHDSQTVPIVAIDIRNDIQKYDPEKRKTEKMDSIMYATQLIKEMKTDLFALEMQEIDQIDERLNKLHDELDDIRSKLVGKLTDTVKKDVDYLNKEERILNRTAASITMLCDTAKQLITNTDDIDVIRRGCSVCIEMDDVLQVEIATPVKGQAMFLKFNPGGTNHSSLDEMLGDISVQSGNDQAETQTPKHREPTTPVPGPNVIGAISEMPVQLIDEHTVAQTEQQSDSKMEVKTLKLVSYNSHQNNNENQGFIFRVCAQMQSCLCCDAFGDIYSLDKHSMSSYGTVQGFCTGITVADDSSVYVTCHDIRAIMKKWTRDKFTHFQSLPFIPQGLTAVPVTGELLVCGGDHGVFSVTGRGVQRTLTEVKFECACDIAVNNNGDICVTDTNKVFIFNSDKCHIGTYDGHETSIRSKIDPWGVTCDSRGDFIVVDHNNHLLHIINRDGVNVSMYDTSNDYEKQPCFVAILPSDQLWVSFGTNVTRVYDIM